MSDASFSIINTIKDAMVQRLTEYQSELKFKKITKDITIDQLADEEQKLLTYMPAAVVVYYGRSGRTQGTELLTSMTFAIIVANRSVSGVHADVPDTHNLLDVVLELFQGKTLAQHVQQDWFDFAGEALQFQSKTVTIYQMLFSTTVALSFRGDPRA